MDDRTLRVLIADRADHVRSAVRLVLCQDPAVIVVGESADTESVLSDARDSRPDLVLIEWELPGQKDSFVVASLKAEWPGLAVIATSARCEARSAALAAGADEFVSKLEPPERLLEAVRECITAGGAAR